MKNWRFRTSFMGKLILQRSYSDCDVPFPLWRDATTEDLLDYFNEVSK
jgi:hypothetical protein